MRGFAWLWMLGLAACTAPNPAYEGTGAEPTGTSDGETGVVTAGSVASIESSGEPADCVLHDERLLTIARLDANGTHVEPDCSSEARYELLPIGRIIRAENTFTHTECDTPQCPCPNATGPETVIQLEGNLLFETAVPIPLPDCGRVALWPKLTDDGCDWGGMLLYEDVGFIPGYIASRTLEVPPLELIDGPLTLELVGEPCAGVAESCAPQDPGAYGLGVFDQVVTVPDSPSYDVYVTLVGQEERFYFDNRMSSITRECQPLLAWTAQHYPMEPM